MTTFLCQKKSISKPHFTKSDEGPFLTIIFWKWSSWWAEKDSVKQKGLSFKDDGMMVIKIEFTPLPDCNILPFFKGFSRITS